MRGDGIDQDDFDLGSGVSFGAFEEAEVGLSLSLFGEVLVAVEDAAPASEEGGPVGGGFAVVTLEVMHLALDVEFQIGEAGKVEFEIRGDHQAFSSFRRRTKWIRSIL